MKLKNINTSNDYFTSSLRILLNGTQSPIISEQFIPKNNKSLQYLFIESAIKSRLLSEQDLSGIQALLQAGIAKLKAAITPGTSSDLDVLMSFMAPGTGGSSAIKELIDAAGQITGPLSQDQDWWNNFFSTLNIQDRSDQKNLQYQVADEVGQEMLRDPGLPSPKQEEPSPEAQKIPETQDNQPRSRGERALRKERENATDWAKRLEDLITRRGEDQKQASAHIDRINSKLSQLMQKAPKEDIAAIGDILLEFESVKNNLRPIVNFTIKNINQTYNTDIKPINEAGLFDKLRTMMANPRYAKRTLGQETNAAKNIQAAKLATQLAIQNMRKRFNAKLSNAGLSPDDIIKVYKQWSKLKTSGGDLNQISILEKKLVEAFKLFDLKPSGEAGELTGGLGDGADPLNADTEQPQPKFGGYLPAPQQQNNAGESEPGNTTADSKRVIATGILKKIQSTYKTTNNEKESIKAGKESAQRFYKIAPEITQEVWGIILKSIRKRGLANIFGIQQNNQDDEW